MSTRRRRLVLVVSVLVLISVPATATSTGASGSNQLVAAPVAAGAYRAPLAVLVVVRAFDRGVTRYSAGHRGVDVAAEPGVAVRASARGAVSFAGLVAGRGVVVVAHADGIRTTYEPLRPAVLAGQRVQAGQAVGTVSGRHPGCSASCLHWGARRGDVYLDPLGLLAPLGPVRLLPWS